MENFPILGGVTLLLAGTAVGVATLISERDRAAYFYAQLAAMVGIYVGFAIIQFDAAPFAGRGEISAVLIEFIIAGGFILAGLSVLRGDRSWLIGALILAHGAVDLGHLLFGGDIAPAWYAFACIVYDAIVGLAAIWLLSKKPSNSAQSASSL